MSKTGFDYRKFGMNLFNSLYGKPESTNTNEDEDESVEVYNQLVSKYKNKIEEGKLTNAQLIIIIEKANGNIDRAKQLLNYYLYEPSAEEISGVYDLLESKKNVSPEKVRNFLKYHKNVYAAVENIDSGKKSTDILEEVTGLDTVKLDRETLKKYTDKAGETNRFMGNVNLVNNGNTCFMNAGLQLLYHIPEFKEQIVNFNLEDATFKNEFKENKYEPLKALKNIFEDLDEARTYGNKKIDIGIHLNPYFECLWKGPYGKETDEQFRKRIELDSGLFIEDDYTDGKPVFERYMEVIERKQRENPDERREIRRAYRKLNNEILDKIINGAPFYEGLGRIRGQHDIGDFLLNCIFNKFDITIREGGVLVPKTTSTKPLLNYLSHYTQDIYEIHIPKNDEYDADFPKETRRNGDTTIEYREDNNSHILIKKRIREEGILRNYSSLVDINDETKSLELQNIIVKENYELYNTFDANLNFLVVGNNLLYPDLVTKQVKVSWPDSSDYFLLQLDRTNYSNGVGKLTNTVYINKYIEIDGTYLECQGIACQGGGANSGHYWYFWKDDSGRWWVFNDLETEAKIVSEKKPSSPFLDLNYKDVQKDSFVFVYKKIELSKETKKEYAKKVLTELSTDPDLQKLKVLKKEPNDEEIANYSFKYKRIFEAEKQTIDKLVNQDKELDNQEGRKWKKEMGTYYYIRLLEKLGEDKQDYRDFCIKELLRKSRSDLVKLLVKDRERARIPEFQKQIADEEAAKKKLAEDTEESKQKKLNSEEQSKEEKIRKARREAAARERIAKNDETKEEFNQENYKSLLADISTSEIDSGNLIKRYKTDSLITICIFIQQIINKNRTRLPKPPIYASLINIQKGLLTLIKSLDDTSNSGYMKRLLAAKTSEGENIFEEARNFTGPTSYLRGGNRKTMKGKRKSKSIKSRKVY